MGMQYTKLTLLSLSEDREESTPKRFCTYASLALYDEEDESSENAADDDEINSSSSERNSFATSLHETPFVLRCGLTPPIRANS